MVIADHSKAQEVVFYALSLIETQYRFGGNNPEAGLDCSGMVSYVFQQVAGVRLPHNAAQIAQVSRPIDRDELRPGDLVFFNTNGQPFSHMGIFIGDNRFVHAPSSRGRVRIEHMHSRYFADRFIAGHTLFVR